MKSKIYMIVSISILVISVIASTMALVYYRSTPTSVNLAVEPSLEPFINYSSGTPVLGGSGVILNPISTYEDTTVSTEIEFWKTENARNMDIYGHIYLDITSGSDELLNNKAVKWAVTSNNILISEGDFTGYTEGESVPILVNQKLLSNYTTFKIYIWIDENAITDVVEEGEVFSLLARCEATSSEIDISKSNTFDYTGDIQTINLSSGTYQLEVWGAQGGYGYSETYRGGYGGYSKGSITLSEADRLFVAVGGQGGNGLSKVNTLNPGGFNGGGNTYGATNKYTGSGGGATHIALIDNTLNLLSENTNDILIVAGGGGGSSYYQETSWNLGGNGGGYIGNDGTRTDATAATYGYGGTQTSGGTGYINGLFGQGANATAESIGGGGGYYGGGAGRYNSSGGGGSGYIGNPLLTSKEMYCYECDESPEEDTKTISTNCAEETPTPNCAKKLNGYAKITKLTGSVELLPRNTITYGTNYDFKTMISNELGLTVIYSTYDNANTLSIGEYQIKYIAEDTLGNEFVYYQKVEIVGGN